MSNHSQILVQSPFIFISVSSSFRLISITLCLPSINLVCYVYVYILFIQMLYVNQLESLLLCSTSEKKANKHRRVQKVFRTNYVSYDIYVYTNVLCVVFVVSYCSVFCIHRTLLCCKRHSRILCLFFLLHISVCHLKIYGFAHNFFSLPFDVLFSLRGNHNFSDIFLQFLPFSFVLIAIGAFVYIAYLFTSFHKFFFRSCLVFVPIALSQVLCVTRKFKKKNNRK